MVGDDKGRENLGDYGIFFDFFLILGGDFLGGSTRSSSEHSEYGEKGEVGGGGWRLAGFPSAPSCSECSECSGAFWWVAFFL